MNNDTMNRIHNCTNPHQGEAKRVLCVCSAGLLRSPTTAKVLAEEFGCNTRAAGAVPEYALIPVDTVLLSWAEEVVFMQEEHRAAVDPVLLEGKEVLVLNIPDRFSYNDPVLVALIKERYSDRLLEKRTSDE